MRFAGRSAVCFLLALAACQPSARETVTPALWEVQGPHGEQGWLFGTVHALPEPVNWQSGPMKTAIAGSDQLVMEVANTDDPAALGKVFASLSRTPGQLPLAQRVAPELRAPLAALMREFKIDANQFGDVETWAAALALSKAAQGADDGANGIENQLHSAVGKKPVAELEGAAAQLGIFDRLPEADQRTLLDEVIKEIAAASKDDPLGKAWKRGDMTAMARETRTGLLADPELRSALLEQRNHAWADKLEVMLAGGARPLVAVGAAHLAGPDGLPALLAARGYRVTRIQ